MDNRLPVEVAAFLFDIAQVCKKHNMLLIQEDYESGFLVTDYKWQDIKWLLQAYDAREIP